MKQLNRLDFNPLLISLVTTICVIAVWVSYYIGPGTLTYVWYLLMVFTSLAFLINAMLFSEECLGNSSVDEIKESKDNIINIGVIYSTTSINIGLVFVILGLPTLGIATIALSVYTLFYINTSDKFINKADRIIDNKG